MVSRESRISQREVSDSLNEALHQIALALSRGETVQLTTFGTFYSRMRQQSTARSFATGEPIAVPARRVAAFRVGDTLKEAVKGR